MRVARRAAASFSPRQYEGSLDAEGLRVGVVCARWNPTVTDAMLTAALDTLRRRGARAADVSVARVPGAFEVAAGAKALVRGQTTHHEVLGHSVASALSALTVEAGIPIGFGILTCETMEQARERTDKGVEAAEAAIEMANLRRSLGKA